MKKSLVMFCSGTGFTRGAFAFIERQIPPEERDFDILSVPGCIYSLASSHEDFEHHQSSLGDQIVFLVEKHKLTKILVLDHSECAWFNELSTRDKAFFSHSSEEMLKKTLDILRNLVPEDVNIRCFKGKKTIKKFRNLQVPDLQFYEVAYS